MHLRQWCMGTQSAILATIQTGSVASIHTPISLHALIMHAYLRFLVQEIQYNLHMYMSLIPTCSHESTVYKHVAGCSRLVFIGLPLMAASGS